MRLAIIDNGTIYAVTEDNLEGYNLHDPDDGDRSVLLGLIVGTMSRIDREKARLRGR